MTENSKDITERQIHEKRLAALSKDRKRILNLPGDQALNEILDHPQPNALVHSFAEEDLCFLIHDIGPESSLELLSLASARQWEYIIDIESWEKDKININAVTHWMNLMQLADPQRFIRWAAIDKPELIEYYLFKTIEIIVREHDQDPSDFGDDFITYDDIFYFKLPDDLAPVVDGTSINKDQNLFLSRMLRHLADIDHKFFQHTLLRSANVIPAESEEEAFRFRNVRLAEKGFLPFDEAVGVYQPISLDLLKKRHKIIKAQTDLSLIVPVPIHHTAMLEEKNIFTRALSKITIEDTIHQLQIEFAGVCNQIISADQTLIHEREQLKTIVKKACGYISIGLECLAADAPLDAENQSTTCIIKYPLIDIFRAGYGCVAELQQKAKKWQQQGWFTKNKLSLSFWDEKFVGIIGGLLLKRPRFFDNYNTGVLYREFESLAEVKQTRTDLDAAMGFDNLLSNMSVNTDEFPKDQFVTHKNLLLTLWARHHLGLSLKPEAIALNQFIPFYKDIWEPKGGAAIKESKKTDFLKWLSSETNLPEDEISKSLGSALEQLFDEIVDEYGTISADQLDPRHVHLFLLRKD